MKIKNLGFIVILMLSSVLIVGCSSTGTLGSTNETIPLISGYTCCNLRNEGGGDWISELTYTKWNMIPLGTPASVTEYGRNRAHLNLGGKPMRLGQDYTRKSLSLEQYVRRIIVPEDPNMKLATFPKEIGAGQITVGRYQIIFSLNPSHSTCFYRRIAEQDMINRNLYGLLIDTATHRRIRLRIEINQQNALA